MEDKGWRVEGERRIRGGWKESESSNGVARSSKEYYVGGVRKK